MMHTTQTRHLAPGWNQRQLRLWMVCVVQRLLSLRSQSPVGVAQLWSVKRRVSLAIGWRPSNYEAELAVAHFG